MRSVILAIPVLSQRFTDPLAASGTGYIGSFTALALLEADYNVVVLDNLQNSSEEALNRIELICGKRPLFHNVDVRDEAAIDKVFDAHPDIDSVIHFAALKVRTHPLLRLLAPIPALLPGAIGCVREYLLTLS